MTSSRGTSATFGEPAFDERQPILTSIRSVRWAAPIGLGLLGALSILSTDDGPVLCPFRRCTAGYCPGCGLTRAGGHLLRGQFSASWAQHPYLILLLAQLPLISLAWITGSTRVKSKLGDATITILIVNALLMLGIWVARLLASDIPRPSQISWS